MRLKVFKVLAFRASGDVSWFRCLHRQFHKSVRESFIRPHAPAIAAQATANATIVKSIWLLTS